MNLTDEGLNLVERQADKSHDGSTMFLCQILREIRELKQLLHQCKYACDGCNNSAGSANNSENKHS